MVRLYVPYSSVIIGNEIRRSMKDSIEDGILTLSDKRINYEDKRLKFKDVNKVYTEIATNIQKLLNSVEENGIIGPIIEPTSEESNQKPLQDFKQKISETSADGSLISIEAIQEAVVFMSDQHLNRTERFDRFDEIMKSNSVLLEKLERLNVLAEEHGIYRFSEACF